MYFLYCATVTEYITFRVAAVHADLQALIEPFLLRRIKTDVLKDLPRKSEVVLYHGITALQKKYYKAILQNDIGYLTDIY